MKSIIAHVSQWGKNETVVITYTTQEELLSKMEALNKECQDNNKTVGFDFSNYNLRTL
jgi:hypothetical protein